MGIRLPTRLSARLRWSGRVILRVVGFTLAVCLAIGASILLLFGVVWFVESVLGQAALAGAVGLGVFVAAIALSVQLLVVLSDRLHTDDRDDAHANAEDSDADVAVDREGAAGHGKRQEDAGGDEEVVYGTGGDSEMPDSSAEPEAETETSDARCR